MCRLGCRELFHTYLIFLYCASCSVSESTDSLEQEQFVISTAIIPAKFKFFKCPSFQFVFIFPVLLDVLVCHC